MELTAHDRRAKEKGDETVLFFSLGSASANNDKVIGRGTRLNKAKRKCGEREKLKIKNV